MKLFLDTEFNGFGGEIISLALVPEDDGDEFYEVCGCSAPIEPWVAAHVVPILNRTPISFNLFRQGFHNFVRQYDNPEVICDWHADAVHFCEMLAGDDYGTSLDFACRVTILKTPPGQPVSALPHNALEDARALKRWFFETTP